MNNEEKILSILEAMQGDISELKAGQAKLEAGQAKLEAGQKQIRKDIHDIRFELKEGVWDEVQNLHTRVRALEKRAGMY